MPELAELTTQPTNDPNMKAYHTRHVIASVAESGRRGTAEITSEFGSLLLNIDGVIQYHICPYVILITKANLFTWEEVEPKVNDLLVSYILSQRQLESAAALSLKDLENDPAAPVDRDKGHKLLMPGTPRRPAKPHAGV